MDARPAGWIFRGAPARTMVTAIVLAVLVVGVPSVATAEHDLPPLTETGVGPAEAGAVLVERASGPVAGEADGWRLNMDVILRNDGTDDLALEQVRVAYTGGSSPSDQVIAIDPDNAPFVIRPVAPDPNVEDDPGLPAETILASDARRAHVPEDRILPFPVPDQVTVEFTIEGFGDPVSVTRDLVEYDPPGGTVAFPFAATDLDDGEFVGTGQNHSFGSAHRGSVTQRFAYDFNVRRWNGSGWVTRDGPIGDNDSYFIWEEPVYAIADGTVTSCFRDVPDNPNPPDKLPELFLDEDDPAKIPGGGNSYWIQHASGEYTLYAHLQQGSIPDELCPDDPEELYQGVAGAEVKSGQLLGFVGNSGSSGGPHLHIHTQKGEGGSGNGRPLMFHNIRAVDAATYDPDLDAEAAWRTVNGAAVTRGEFAGYGQVDAMLIDPQPRINLELTKVDDVDPVVAGTELDYTLTVTNHGPGAAPNVLLADWLPDEVEFVSDDGDCVWQLGARLCVLGDLAAGEQAAPITIKAAVPHDLVYVNGGPLTITNEALVSSFGGPFEATEEDNEAIEDTDVIAAADLELVGFEVIDPLPAQLLIGDDAQLSVRSTITNHGPSWPMDGEVVTLADAPGVIVAPPGSAVVATAVELAELRQVDETFTITCQEPGVQAITFTAEVTPAHPDDVDPNLANNTAAMMVEVDCVVPMAINIRPGNPHNQVNPGSHGIVPVAGLTTAIGEYDLPIAFDATSIIVDTVRFGRGDLVWSETGGAPDHNGAHIKDAHELDDKTKDGDLDMVLSFRTSSTGSQADDGEACMKGLFEEDGGGVYAFFGCDEIRPVPPN